MEPEGTNRIILGFSLSWLTVKAEGLAVGPAFLPGSGQLPWLCLHLWNAQAILSLLGTAVMF